MRFLFLALLGLSFFQTAFGTDSLLTYVYTDASQSRHDFSDSLLIFLDHDERYSINKILQSPELKFTRFDKKQDIQFPLVVWSRIQLKNESSKTRADYLTFCNFSDSIKVYTIENGVVIDSILTGLRMNPSNKSLPSAFNYIPFTIDPGKQKTYYFKSHFKKKLPPHHLNHFYIQDGQALIQRLVDTHTLQSFYTGIMVLFCMVSLFMAGLFRERVFIYLAVLLLVFTLYFLERSAILDTLFIYNYRSFSNTPLQLIISGITISFFLFVSHYIRLSTRLPKYYRVYLCFSLFVAAFAHVSNWLNQDLFWTLQVNNILLLLWVILTIIPVIILVRKGDQQARILLASIGVLFVGALLIILDASQIISSNILTQNGFQLGTILFAGLLFYGLFDKINAIREEKLRFEELDHLKSRFFANISHEFRTPLTLVMGPIKQVLEKTEDSKKQNLLQLAHQNAQRLLQLINQLLDLSKLEAGKMDLATQEQNFAALLKGIVMSFESLAIRKGIRLHFVTQKEAIPLYVDKDMIEKIFYNLLSNAFKFTPDHGEVSVMITERNKQIEVLVRDNGIGIPATRLAHIFDRFFQVDSSETREQEGTGIGLALVKELVQLHSGSISVESIEDKGTTFTILLPKGKEHLKENEITATAPLSATEAAFHSEHNEAILEPSPISIQYDPSNERPQVLIIEDNTDVRTYIKQHLVSSFQILEAVNGQEGIDLALEQLPDLIISDVMMPQKNGYEVCQALKTDPRSSHIPIILLTAKATQEEKLQGLETGADDYLVKPFDTRELEVRVRKLIELRQQLRQRFSQEATIEPKAIKTNAVDQAFLEKICTSIEAHLTDGQFSVEVLAQEIGMSRVHLNRKLKALTDQSANKFIQSFRLQKALHMLQQKAGNVSEIAFETGFSSTAYFVKCFGDKYGKTPGAVLQE